MSYFGTLLELADESRLTGVAVYPAVEGLVSSESQFVVHRIRFLDDVPADAAAGALATFLPYTVAALAGVTGFGSWAAVIRAVPRGTPPGAEATPARFRRLFRHAVTADAGVSRAMGLTGLSGDVHAFTRTGGDLRTVYATAGLDVGDWSGSELLVGLLYELATNMGPQQIGAAVTHPTLTGEARRAHRSDALHMLLREWAATYQGPRA